MRVNNSLLRRFWKLTADYRLSCSIQIIIRTRQCAKVKIGVGSLMYDVAPVHDDGAGQNLQATVQEWRRTGFGKKTNRSAAGLDCYRIDLWQRYMKSLNQEPVHADLCNLGMEMSLRRRN